jgi:hypothetical protein
MIDPPRRIDAAAELKKIAQQSSRILVKVNTMDVKRKQQKA